MRIVSWNVNGLRSILAKGFPSFLRDSDADIVCLQEIKARADQVDHDFAGYHIFWNPALKPGYSGTAILTREVTTSIHSQSEDADYVAGLVHDVGKIVMAWAFPDHFSEIHRQAAASGRNLVEIENEILGIDHCELGARYLERNRLPELMINSARYHHQPEKATQYPQVIAAVQIADLLIRSEKIGVSGDHREVTREECFTASGWKVLLHDSRQAEQNLARASLLRTLEQMPQMLEGLL